MTTLTTASTSSASGQAMPVGDLSTHWRQIFTEDFTTPTPLGSFPGPAYAAKWWPYSEWWNDTSKHGLYSAKRVLSVADSCLDIYLHTENGQPLVATIDPILFPPHLGNKPPVGQLWGRYSVRFCVPQPIPGYKTAWLLWPDSETWPQDGEIDFPEGNLDSLIHAYVHHQDGQNASDQDAYNSNVPYVQPGHPWHTATMIWYPDRLGNPVFEAWLDSVCVGKSTSRVPNTPMHYALQTETCLSGPAPDPAVSGHILVDWLVAYQYIP